MSDISWTEPAVDEVAPGVHRIPLPLPNDGLRAVNVYAITDDEEVTLVDAGWSIPDAYERLIAALAELDRSPADVKQFLITHVHRDHYTMAVALRRESGGRISLGEGEQPSLEVILQPDRKPLEHQLGRLRTYGAGELADAVTNAMRDHHPDLRDWERPDEWLTPGTVNASERRALEVVPTPGHTRGHVVFHDLSAGLLFAGDHVLPTITPSIGFEPVLSPDPLGEFLRSLALVRSRPDATLLPAHGPVRDSVHARVDELLAHHGRRLDETERAVRDGADTAYAAARVLTWTRRERRLDDLDLFNQMLAIAETAAHLELLAAQGRVSCENDDEAVRHYGIG